MAQPPTTPVIPHELVREIPSMTQKTFRNGAAGAASTFVWEFDLAARVTDANQFLNANVAPANSATTAGGGAGPQTTPQPAVGAFLDVFVFTSGAGGGTLLIEEAADANPCNYRTVNTVAIAAGVEGGVQGFRVTGRFVRCTFTNVTAAAVVEVGYYLRSVEGGNPASGGGGGGAVGPVTPGTGASNLGKAEGQAFVAGDVGVEVLGVLDDGTIPLPAIGDYSNPRMDPTTGAMKTQVFGANGANRTPVDVQDVDGSGSGAVLVQFSPNGFNIVGLSGNLIINVPQTSPADTFAAAGNGATQAVTPGLYKYFSFQVVPNGAVTSWDIRFEVSLDGGTSWGQLLAITNVDGTVVKTPITATPVTAFRTRCAGIVLGAGVSVTAFVVAMG